jgi:hypothetical protein
VNVFRRIAELGLIVLFATGAMVVAPAGYGRIFAMRIAVFALVLLVELAQSCNPLLIRSPPNDE